MTPILQRISSSITEDIELRDKVTSPRSRLARGAARLVFNSFDCLTRAFSPVPLCLSENVRTLLADTSPEAQSMQVALCIYCLS